MYNVSAAEHTNSPAYCALLINDSRFMSSDRSWKDIKSTLFCVFRLAMNAQPPYNPNQLYRASAPHVRVLHSV